MKKRTSEGAEKREPRSEEERRILREREEERPSAREDAAKVRSEPYFPEVFLG